MLLLEAQSFELANGFHSLIHCGSLGTGGTLAEVNSQSAFLPKFMEQQIREAYFGFLTEPEIDELIRGKDFWIGAEEWMERYHKRNEFIKSYLDKPEAPPPQETVKEAPKAPAKKSINNC